MSAGARRCSGRNKGWPARQHNSSLLVSARQLQALVRQRHGLGARELLCPASGHVSRTRPGASVVRLRRPGRSTWIVFIWSPSCAVAVTPNSITSTSPPACQRSISNGVSAAVVSPTPFFVESPSSLPEPYHTSVLRAAQRKLL